MDVGAWWAAVHGVARSWTRQSDFTFTFHFHALEKAMAPHSSTLAWKIPWMEEPGRQQSMGLIRVTNLDSKFKSRDITLPTKVRLVKVMVCGIFFQWPRMDVNVGL